MATSGVGSNLRPGRRQASLFLMLASGFAGLGYQIVWTQQCALWLGHESAGVLAVVTAFFGGLAVGAFAFGRRIEQSSKPMRWYAGCELVVALWSLVLAFAMPPVSAWLLELTGVQPSAVWQWSVAFIGTFTLLLPATAAMGATLPAMERIVAAMRAEDRSIAALYASNTLGAVIGVLAIAFWLAPTFGLVRTAAFCVALNVVCGVASLVVFREPAEAQAANAEAADADAVGPASIARITRGDSRPNAGAAAGVLARLALTGFLGIGYEVLIVRVLSQVAEDTVYTFSMLLAVYLVGTAGGAALYARWRASRRQMDAAIDRVGDRLLCALASACLISTGSLWAAEHIKGFMLQQRGGSMTSALIAEATLALVAFGPPTVVMGALFSHLSSRALAAGVTFGRALRVNTLGAAAAPVVFGVLAFPALGPKTSLVIVALGYVGLVSRPAWQRSSEWLPIGAPMAAAVAVLCLAPPLAFVDVPEGGHIVAYKEGVMAAVSVVEDANGVARLRIDNRQQEGSSSTLRVDSRQALLPVLLHPAPRHALFLGLGTGITASSAAQDPSLEVDAVELLPEVISTSEHFTRVFQDSTPNPRLHLMAADARRYVRVSDREYDVIVSDNFHPARSGSGSLYTVEHFGAVRERLAPGGGVFCQWLPLHQLDLDTLRSIVRSFMAVFPNGTALLASNSLETPVLGLVGRRDTQRLDVAALHDRLTHITLPDELAHVGLEDEFAVLGSFVAGPKALKRFAGNAPANTDDHPVVAYAAPRITYAPDTSPGDRLISLLQKMSVAPDEVITPSNDSWPTRLAAYWAARDRFIESGRNVHASRDVHDMLAQVREPLLAVLRISPDFRPAYDPLLLMATALSQTDTAGARSLLTELTRMQPDRPEAQLALAELGSVVSR